MAAGNADYCNTELCLTPGGRSSNSTQKRPEMSVSGASEKKISFFYGGQVCACDVTEIQARAIICMAKREMEEIMRSSGEYSTSALGNSLPEPQLLNSKLSMKRSLQSFLQKRKTRACESTSSYLIQNQQNLQSDSSSSS